MQTTRVGFLLEPNVIILIVWYRIPPKLTSVHCNLPKTNENGYVIICC